MTEIIKKTSFKNDEIVFFGDALTDYNAASFHNINFIGVKSHDTIFPQNTFLIDNFDNFKF